MVVSTSLSANNGPTHENEKKRKQTVERARVNHLSRQLQMRLQYAKLKVDHGWQKQNLNEVENLYFHHSHQRIPKPYVSPLMMTAILNEASGTNANTADPSSNSPQSSLSSRVDGSLGRSHASTSLASESPPQIQTGTLNASTSESTSTNNQFPSNQTIPAAPINPIEMRNLIQMEVDSENKPLPAPTPATMTSQHQPTAGPSRIALHGTVNYPASHSSFGSDRAPPPTPVATTWVTNGPRPPPTSSPSSFNHYSNAPLLRTPTLPASPGLSESSFSFPGVSLTYDSFWSSHSSSASARSLRTSLSSIAPLASSGVDSSGGMTDTYTFKSYQVPEPASTRIGQRVGVGATAGKE